MEHASREPIVTLEMDPVTVDTILDHHGRDPSAIIAILQDLQEEVNYLPEGTLRYVARALDIPTSRVSSLATFYRAFSLEPRGKHQIYVCTGTACHVRGAVKIIDTLEREIGIRAGETDQDLKFTLETVNCVGACALGPVLVVDGVYHGQMTSTKARRLIRRLQREEEEQDRDEE